MSAQVSDFPESRKKKVLEDAVAVSKDSKLNILYEPNEWNSGVSVKAHFNLFLPCLRRQHWLPEVEKVPEVNHQILKALDLMVSNIKRHTCFF